MPRVPTQEPQPAPTGQFAAPVYVPQTANLSAAVRGPSPAEIQIDRLAAIEQQRQEDTDRAAAQSALNDSVANARQTVMQYRTLLGRNATGDARKEAVAQLREQMRQAKDS